MLTSAPKLVAMSIGWMTRAKSMSEVARATMKMSVEVVFVGRSNIAIMTKRLEKKLRQTLRKNSIFQLINVNITYTKEVDTNAETLEGN